MQSIPFPVPERTPEQIASAVIVVGMGGQVRHLPVLPIEHNETWTKLFSETISGALAQMPAIDTLADVTALGSVGIERMVDLLVAYDRTGALGGRDVIRATATPPEVYEAMKQVTAAAFPFGADLARFAPQLRPLLIEALAGVMTSSASTKPSPKRTGGRRRGSGAS